MWITIVDNNIIFNLPNVPRCFLKHLKQSLKALMHNLSGLVMTTVLIITYNLLIIGTSCDQLCWSPGVCDQRTGKCLCGNLRHVDDFCRNGEYRTFLHYRAATTELKNVWASHGETGRYKGFLLHFCD